MPDTKRCPYCAEEILAAARVCKHCHRDLELEGQIAGQIAQAQRTESANLKSVATYGAGLAIVFFVSELRWSYGAGPWVTGLGFVVMLVGGWKLLAPFVPGAVIRALGALLGGLFGLGLVYGAFR